jgi:hypothetical protein
LTCLSLLFFVGRPLFFLKKNSYNFIILSLKIKARSKKDQKEIQSTIKRAKKEKNGGLFGFLDILDS